MQREDEQYNQELRSKAKTTEQLTVGLECLVKNVEFYQSTGSVRTGTVRYGSPLPASTKTGYFFDYSPHDQK